MGLDLRTSRDSIIPINPNPPPSSPRPPYDVVARWGGQNGVIGLRPVTTSTQGSIQGAAEAGRGLWEAEDQE